MFQEPPWQQPSKGILMSLADKVAIVTGGSSGIGKAIALELAKHSPSVVIDYVSHPNAIEALEQEIVALGDRVIRVEADVSKLDDLQKLASAVKRLSDVIRAGEV